MIKNIKEHQSQSMRWWSWTEICDNCGVTIENNNVLHSSPPEEHEIHLCSDCLRYFLDNNIDYDAVKNFLLEEGKIKENLVVKEE